MTLYEYKAADGECLLIERPITKAPKIGHTIRRKGKTFARIISLAPRSSIKVKHWHVVGHSQPRAQTPQQMAEFGYKRTDARGKPIYTTQQEVRDYVAQSDGRIDYDGDY